MTMNADQMFKMYEESREKVDREDLKYMLNEFKNQRDAALLQIGQLQKDKEELIEQRDKAYKMLDHNLGVSDGVRARLEESNRLNSVLQAEVAQKDLCIKDLTSSERVRVPDLLKDLEDYSRGEITLSRLGEILNQSPAVLRAVFVRAANHMSGKDQETEKRIDRRQTCAECGHTRESHDYSGCLIWTNADSAHKCACRIFKD